MMKIRTTAAYEGCRTMHFETEVLGIDNRDFYRAKQTGNTGQNRNLEENKDILMSPKPFAMSFDIYESIPKKNTSFPFQSITVEMIRNTHHGKYNLSKREWIIANQLGILFVN